MVFMHSSIVRAMYCPILYVTPAPPPALVRARRFQVFDAGNPGEHGLGVKVQCSRYHFSEKFALVNKDHGKPAVREDE